MRFSSGTIGTALAALLAIVLTTTACGSSSNDDQSSGATTGYPVSIKSALGTATIKDRPQRVVTLGWGSNDAALALGVVPVGMSIQVQGDKGGLTPWARARLQGKQTVTFSDNSDQLPVEKIAALHPDVILAVYSGLTDQQYSTLSRIAPTVGYPDQPWATTWQTQLMTVGKALGRTAQAKSLEAKVTSQVAATKKAHPEFTGTTISYGSGTKAGSYNLYYQSDPRMSLLGQFGFTVSDAASKDFARGAGSPKFANSISLEQLDTLKSDVLVAWYLSPATKQSIEGSTVFRQLPSVSRGAYVPITDEDLLFATSAPNVLTIPWMLKAYVPLLSAAAKKAGK